MDSNSVDRSRLQRATEFEYNERGQLESETLPHLGTGWKTSYNYYAADALGGSVRPGALSEVQLTSAGLSTQYAYDDAGRLKTITNTDGKKFAYDYYPGDMINTVASPNGVTTIYDRNGYSDGRVAAIHVNDSLGAPIYSVTYSFYPDGQQQSAYITRRMPDGTTQSYTNTFAYDAQDQLEAATIHSQSFAYNFNDVGNRTDSDFVANALNQYTTAPGLVVLGSYSPQYDARGNLIADQTRDYVYDAQDRLIAVVADSNWRVTYGYDHQGRKIWKKNYLWDWDLNNGEGGWVISQHRAFVYDGWNLMAEYKVIGPVKTLLKSYT